MHYMKSRLGLNILTNNPIATIISKKESELSTLLYIYGTTCVGRLGIEQTDEQLHCSHHLADT